MYLVLQYLFGPKLDAGLGSVGDENILSLTKFLPQGLVAEEVMFIVPLAVAEDIGLSYTF